MGVETQTCITIEHCDGRTYKSEGIVRQGRLVEGSTQCNWPDGGITTERGTFVEDMLVEGTRHSDWHNGDIRREKGSFHEGFLTLGTFYEEWGGTAGGEWATCLREGTFARGELIEG